MSDEAVQAPLLEALADLSRWLDATGARSVIIGGVAASILGRPRTTRDIDALLDLEESAWELLLSTGADYGFEPRLHDAAEFARQARVLLMRHAKSMVDVDIVFAGLSFERDAIARGSRIDIGGVSVRLPAVEDLVVMKAVAQRPRDLADVEALLAAHPNLDVHMCCPG